MEHLWSPWRMKYVQQQEKRRGCVFCDALKEPDGQESLVVHRGRLAFVILNRFPYASGHLMVVPNVHQPSFENLDREERSEIMELLNESTQILRVLYKPDAFNVGANIGAPAGAGIAEHFHFHVVPRWAGDTNFMTTLANTRVLPEGLDETYLRIKNTWNGASA